MNDLTSNCWHPQILVPTQISGNSKITIGDVHSSIAQPSIITDTGNITDITGNISHR